MPGWAWAAAVVGTLLASGLAWLIRACRRAPYDTDLWPPRGAPDQLER